MSATLVRDKRSKAKAKSYYLKFRYCGKQYKYGLGHSDKVLAGESLGKVRRTLRDLEEGVLVLPEGGDLIEFVKTDGGRSEKIAAPEKPLTLGELAKLYPEKLTEGSKKSNSLSTNLIHLRHFVRVLGASCTLVSLTKPGALQEYVAKRAGEKRRKRTKVGGVTIKKEMGTLGTVWKWAFNNGHTKTRFPAELVSKLDYPKGRDKARFEPWAVIEDKIARGGLSKDEQKELWDCVFLDKKEVEEVLEFVRKKHLNDWLYPALVLVAHTGARRSEMLRLQVGDINFSKQELRITEYKRKRGKVSFRDVPMSDVLAGVLHEYMGKSHRGRFVISINPKVGDAIAADKGVEEYVEWSKKRASMAFREVFEKSKWAVLHGFHTFRHSLISIMASESIDQRLIDDIVGHETEAMRQRYRHIFPQDKQAVIRKLFGEGQATASKVSAS